MFTCNGEIIEKLYVKDSEGKWMQVSRITGSKAAENLLDNYVMRTYKYSNIKRMTHDTVTKKDYVCKVITFYYSNGNKAVYYL